ncbi:MAG: hypothetical protein EAZ97_15595 [Bacteroidetes bacterium]|nr:MAG: hypothetical protein EAZ97_15595 [Bacteroidota bacterium]
MENANAISYPIIFFENENRFRVIESKDFFLKIPFFDLLHEKYYHYYLFDNQGFIWKISSITSKTKKNLINYLLSKFLQKMVEIEAFFVKLGTYTLERLKNEIAISIQKDNFFTQYVEISEIRERLFKIESYQKLVKEIDFENENNIFNEDYIA